MIRNLYKSFTKSSKIKGSCLLNTFLNFLTSPFKFGSNSVLSNSPEVEQLQFETRHSSQEEFLRFLKLKLWARWIAPGYYEIALLRIFRHQNAPRLTRWTRRQFAEIDSLWHSGNFLLDFHRTPSGMHPNKDSLIKSLRKFMVCRCDQHVSYDWTN